MPKSYKTNVLNVNSINTLIKNLTEYRNNLNAKTELFLQLLIEKGFSVASSNNGGEYGKYIYFTKNIHNSASGYVGELTMRTDATIIESWYTSPTTIDSREVDILLMQEYGSGQYAHSPSKNTIGVVAGRGTFPTDSKHGFENVWHYKDAYDDRWHSYNGYVPSSPMDKALVEMITEIYIVARQVFGVLSK